MAGGVFSDPSFEAIEPGALFLSTSIGLAITAPPEAMPLPAAILVFGLTADDDKRSSIQILSSVNTLAALHGSLRAWSERLPVGARDQFEALAAEASTKWTDRVNAIVGGAS